MKPKLIFIYSVVLIYLISLGLTHLNESFIHLSMISMGFIFGFMANECFFDRKDSKDLDYWVYPNPKYPITEGNTLSNIRTNYNRQMPIDPPPSLSKSLHENKETMRVSFVFDAEDDLAEELEFLDTKKLISRIRETVANHIKDKIQSDPDFLKNIKVNFSYNSRTREQIISSMCFTKRHDYGLMTEDERKFLYREMAQIFDNDIAPYMEFKSITHPLKGVGL